MISLQEFKRDILDELEDVPFAMATLKGSAAYPDLRGTVLFFETNGGVIVLADVENLPVQTACGSVYGFHIHEGMSCGGDDFAQTMGHYNPTDCPHPYHAGDLPPLFRNDGPKGEGGAWMAVLTDRFTLQEIVGRTVVIHDRVDDFVSQPAGNSGRKIACGVIRR